MHLPLLQRQMIQAQQRCLTYKQLLEIVACEGIELIDSFVVNNLA